MGASVHQTGRCGSARGSPRGWEISQRFPRSLRSTGTECAGPPHTRTWPRLEPAPPPVNSNFRANVGNMRGSKVPGFRAGMFLVGYGQPEQSANFVEGEAKLPARRINLGRAKLWPS